jgi:hypothetical protein
MRILWSPETPGNVWLAPGLLGVLLIALGVLLYKMPELLAYFVAGLFVLAGCGLIGAAWQMRRRFNYHRVEREWHIEDRSDDKPGV